MDNFIHIISGFSFIIDIMSFLWEKGQDRLSSQSRNGFGEPGGETGMALFTVRG